MRWRWARAVCLVATMLLAAGVAAPAAAQPDPDPSLDPDAQALADKYAPVMYLAVQPAPSDKKGEAYHPAPVEMVLGNEGIGLMEGNPSKEVARGATAAEVFHLPKKAYFDFSGNPRSPGCANDRAFRALSPQAEGTYAHVVGEEREDGSRGIALQNWFFYYFNDADNSHEGDWKMIQLSWDVATVAEALARDPDRAAYAQHNGGEIAEWTDDKLLKEDDHPVVFAALGSHGSYYDDGIYLMYGEVGTGLGCDDTSRPTRRAALTPILVPTDIGDQDHPFA